MKLKTIIDTLRNFLSSVQKTAVATLKPEAEEAGFAIGQAVRDGLQQGFQRGIMHESDTFASGVIEAEAVRIDKPKRKARMK